MNTNEISESVRHLQQQVESGGVRAALSFLNARAPHRFTGIYRCEPPMLRSVLMFDRENPFLEVGSDVPLQETYCSITSGTAAPFSTADARQDARLLDHPARESTLSYCGVPLLDEQGAAFGTLCHFDLIPRPIPHTEISLMQAAVPIVLRALRESGTFPPA